MLNYAERRSTNRTVFLTLWRDLHELPVLDLEDVDLRVAQVAVVLVLDLAQRGLDIQWRMAASTLSAFSVPAFFTPSASTCMAL